MRILIYGAGTIGCLYGALFSEAGVETAIYARGKRLELLREKGLRFCDQNRVKRARVKILSELSEEDRYDFIFLCVKQTQVHSALVELRKNRSPNIVTFVNSLEPYSHWEELCGAGRLIPGFPGAGGGFEQDILNASLTPYLIQPTSFGEIGGQLSERVRILASLFGRAKIPYQIIPDMHAWQICHLAMVVPLAQAYYEARVPSELWKDLSLMRKTARRLKRNFFILKWRGISLTPVKMNLFVYLPVSVMAKALSLIYRSEFANLFMYRHSMNAPEEMTGLKKQFYKYLFNPDFPVKERKAFSDQRVLSESEDRDEEREREKD